MKSIEQLNQGKNDRDECLRELSKKITKIHKELEALEEEEKRVVKIFEKNITHASYLLAKTTDSNKLKARGNASEIKLTMEMARSDIEQLIQTHRQAIDTLQAIAIKISYKSS